MQAGRQWRDEIVKHSTDEGAGAAGQLRLWLDCWCFGWISACFVAQIQPFCLSVVSVSRLVVVGCATAIPGRGRKCAGCR